MSNAASKQVNKIQTTTTTTTKTMVYKIFTIWFYFCSLLGERTLWGPFGVQAGWHKWNWATEQLSGNDSKLFPEIKLFSMIISFSWKHIHPHLTFSPYFNLWCWGDSYWVNKELLLFRVIIFKRQYWPTSLSIYHNSSINKAESME